MGISWIRYFAILLIFAGLGIIILGLQYHEALVEKIPTNAVAENHEPEPSFIQSAWALIMPDAEISKNQAGIVSSGLTTAAFGLFMLLLGPMLLQRALERWDL